MAIYVENIRGTSTHSPAARQLSGQQQAGKSTANNPLQEAANNSPQVQQLASIQKMADLYSKTMSSPGNKQPDAMSTHGDVIGRGTVQRVIEMEYDDITGESLDENEVLSPKSLFDRLVGEWGIPPSKALFEELERFNSKDAIFSDTEELIEVLKLNGIFTWGEIEQLIENDWDELMSHYLMGKVSSNKRDGIDGAHFKHVFESFSANYTIETEEDLYPGVKRITYQAKKSSTELYTKKCRKTVTDAGVWSIPRLKTNLLSAAKNKFRLTGIIDGHWNEVGDGGIAISGFVEGGHFRKFNIGVN